MKDVLVLRYLCKNLIFLFTPFFRNALYQWLSLLKQRRFVYVCIWWQNKETCVYKQFWRGLIFYCCFVQIWLLYQELLISFYQIVKWPANIACTNSFVMARFLRFQDITGHHSGVCIHFNGRTSLTIHLI